MSIPAGAADRPAALPETPAPGVPGPAGVRRVLRNALSLLLAYVLPRVFIMGSVVVAARVLGAAQFGAYSTAAAFAVVLSIIATLGMTPLLVREIARAPERAPGLLAAAHTVKTASNGLMLALLVVLARYVLDYPAPVVVASLLLGLSYAVWAYTENLAAWFQAVERMHVWTQASAISGIVAGGLGLALVVGTRSLTWFCVAPILGQVAALAWLAARLPAEVWRGARIAAAEALRLARALAPFAAAFVAITVYYKVDVLLLARWRNDAEVGIYVAAYKAVDIAQALALVVAGAVYPRLSRAVAAVGVGGSAADAGAAGGATRLPPAAARLAEWMLLAVVPTAGLVFLLREPLIAVVYGAEYAASAPVLGWLAATLPALALNVLVGYILGAAGAMRQVAGVYVLGIMANVAANAALIPRHGAAGAAMAMLCSEAFLAVLLVFALRARGAVPAARWLAAAAGAALACAAAALLVGHLPAAAVVVYAVAVGVLYRGTGVLAREDIHLLAQALALRRGAPYTEARA